jgi:hypothetical protein
MKTIRFLHLILLALISPALAANPPGVLNHQGRIAVNGNNYDGTGYFKFALVDGAGTTTYWSNDATSSGGSQPTGAVSALISKGHYAVLLGDTSLPNMSTAIPAAVFTDHQTVALRLWFATASGGPFELLSPDRRIAATGYALAAQRAEAVAPGGVTNTMLADGAVTAAKIANGAVTGLALAPGAVTSGAIADGSVTSYDLALGATGLVRKPVLLSQTGGGGGGIVMAPMNIDSPWSIERVDSDGDVGSWSSLAFGPTGQPAIAYYNATDHSLKFADRKLAAWVTTIVRKSPYDYGKYASLAFSNEGIPSIAYYTDGAPHDLAFSSRPASDWNWQTVDGDGSSDDIGMHASLAFGPSGRPAISYQNSLRGVLKFAEYDGTTWLTQSVATKWKSGRFSSLAFGPTGNPAISYRLDNHGVPEYGVLQYASYSGSEWSVNIVESGGNVGSYSSLAFSPSGQAAISYYDDANGDLKFATCNGGVWSNQVVDSVGDVGRFTSLAFNPAGHPMISYYDVTNGDLKLANYNGITWDIKVIESGGDVGSYSSLDIAQSGEIGISYYDATNGDLKYAEGGGFEWLGRAGGVFVSGGTAFHISAAAGEGNLAVMDVSDPAQPSMLVELASPHPTFALAGSRDVFVTGTTAYLVAANDSALNIMDVSNPASPQLLALLRDGVGGFNRLAGTWSVFVSGNTAYVTATGDDALTIIDVSNPSAPMKLAEIVDEIAGFTKLAGARDVYVVGTTAYVTAAEDNSLTIIDVSSPAAPVLLAEIVDEVGGFTKLGGAREVFVLSDKAYVTADADDALTIVDVSNPASPTLLAEVVDGVGGFNRLDGAAGVHVSGSIAMVTAEGDDAVSMIDVSKPATPVLLEETVDENGGFTKLDGSDGIFVYGTLALVASNQDHALTILDLASPDAEYAGTVTNSALATDSVTSDKILDGSVGNADVGNNAIDSNKIVDASIARNDLGEGVVDSGKITDKSITDADFADSAVTTSALADDSVTSSKILDATIVGADLHADAVTSDKIADGAVGGSKLATGGVATAALAQAAVTGEKLASGSVTLDKLALGGSIGQILYNTGTATEWRNPVAVLGDESPTNELQVLSLVGDSLSLTPGAAPSVNLGQYFRRDGSQAFGGVLDLDGYGINKVGSLTPPLLSETPPILGTLGINGNLSLNGNNLTNVLSITSSGGGAMPLQIKGELFAMDGLRFNGLLNLNGNAITNVLSIVPQAPVPPATMPSISIPGDLDIGGHNLTVHSLTPAGAVTDPLVIMGDLDLNGNRMGDVMKLGIGIGEAQGALHVSTNETSGVPISLLEHWVSGTASGLQSIARLRAVTSGTMNNGFGTGIAFEIKDAGAGSFTIAQIGAARDGANRDGALHFQTANTTDGLTTKMIVRAGGNVEMQRDLYIGTVDATGDDTIYFDSAGSEYLRWQESQTRFMFSDDVWGTTFYETSDRNLKEKFEDVDPMEVLDQVAAMPVTTWKFKEDDSAVRHIGPMAQDFHQAFGLGLDDRHISTTDANGVALAAIQALKRLLDDKERKIQDLEERLQKLEQSNQKNH